MSGIAGIIRFDGAPVESHQVKTMTTAMAHRGPDGINHWVQGSVALGQCMLRTTPESLEETQPLTNEDESLVLVMDGRVDNWEELRNELLSRGARLRTRADAELVLRAYERWGGDFLGHIDGDFALVIWDWHRRAAFCARDRVGVKPFYYHWDGRCLTFASELHAILGLPWVPEKLNEGMVAEIVGEEELSRDETFWHGITRLVAAHRMLVTSEDLRIDEYWAPDLGTELRYKRQEEYVEHYRTLLFDLVRRNSRSHMPLASEVSGGLDSSAIFAVCEHLRREGRLLAPGIEGYTLAFEPGSDAYEVNYARAVGEYLGRSIQEIPPALPPLDWYRNWSKYYRDFPLYPNTVMSRDIYRSIQNRGSRAVLTGYGGDEWLMGSRYYYSDFLHNLQIADYLKAFLQDAGQFGVKRALHWCVRYGVFENLPHNFQAFVRSAIRSNKIIKPTRGDWLSSELKSLLAERKNDAKNQLPKAARVRHRRSLDTLYSAVRARNRESFDVLSSSVGIERRDPLASGPMVEFHFNTPESIRLQSNEYRLCHRLAIQGMIPETVRNRGTKAHFSSTIRGYLSDFDRLGAFPLEKAAHDWVQANEVARLVSSGQQFAGGNGDLWAIWNLFGCVCVSKTLDV